MKINFSAPILDIEGKPLTQKLSARAKEELATLSERTREELGADRFGDKDTTLSSVACTALLMNFPEETSLTGEQKIKRFRLAELAIKGGEQEVSAEDVVELKKLLVKAYTPLVVGRAFDIIEPMVPSPKAASGE